MYPGRTKSRPITQANLLLKKHENLQRWREFYTVLVFTFKPGRNYWFYAVPGRGGGGGGTCNLVDNGCAPRPPSASEFMLWHVDELFISGKKNTVLLIFLFLSLFACFDIKYSSTHTHSHGNKAINNGLACLVMFLSITGLFPARRKSLEQEKQLSALRLF